MTTETAKTKQDITSEEEEKAMLDNMAQFNRQNPSYRVDESVWRGKLAEAKAEGYKSERCSCGVTFLAFHHWTTCQAAGCPFSDGVSMLDQLKQSLATEGTAR